MSNTINTIGLKIGQTDRNGVEITIGCINSNPGSAAPIEIATFVPECAAVLWLTPDIYKRYQDSGVDALEGEDLAMLMILAKNKEYHNINGDIFSNPEILS